jgi:hypothetical protein
VLGFYKVTEKQITLLSKTICITEILKLIHRGELPVGEAALRLCVRLPIWLQTVEELQLIRFWLRIISNTCFQRVHFFKLFDPELIALLFLPTPANFSPVQFRAAELLIFFTALPPLAYGPLVRARAVEFDGYNPFPELLQMACSFPAPPRQVEASIVGDYPYSDREQILFKVDCVVSLLLFRSENKLPIEKLQALRRLLLNQAHGRFPIGDDGINGRCYFYLSDEEISAGTERVVNELALNANPRIRFRVELSGLRRYKDGVWFSHYRVSRRFVDGKGLLAN